MRIHLPPALVEPTDQSTLERRARELAMGAVEGNGAERLQVVAFRLASVSCAVRVQSVVRAVSRLGRVTSVPLDGNTERHLVFVEEIPVQLLDLVRANGRGARSMEALELAPGFLVSTAAGEVAIAVEPPLELSEDEIAGVAPEEEGGDPEVVRTQARLRGGALLIDAEWLLDWAARSVQ